MSAPMPVARPVLRPVLDGTDTFRIVPIAVDAIEIPDDYPRYMPDGFPRVLDEATTKLRDSLASGLAMGAPIVVSPPESGTSYILRDGLRRLLVVRELLGWPFVPCLVTDALDTDLARTKFFLDMNTCRANLTPSQAVALWEHHQEVLAPLFEERRAHPETIPGDGRHLSVVPAAPQGSERRKIAAAATGMSATTLARAKQVIAAAGSTSLSEDQREAVAEQVTLMDTTGKVDRALKNVQQITQAPSVRSQEVLKATMARALSTAATVRATVAAVQEALFEVTERAGDESALLELEAALAEGLESVRKQLADLAARNRRETGSIA